MISETTLRRRRPAIRRYGIMFVERGSGSYYAPADLEHLPDHRPPTAVQKAGGNEHSEHLRREPCRTRQTPKESTNRAGDVREGNL
jgi:hypothetical protein